MTVVYLLEHGCQIKINCFAQWSLNLSFSLYALRETGDRKDQTNPNLMKPYQY